MRYEPANPPPLSRHCVEIKLRTLRTITQDTPTSPRPQSSLSATPDASDPAYIEACFQEHLRGEHRAYHDLIQDGGQPSHRPDDTGFDIINEPGEYAEIISYWTDNWRDSGRFVFRSQLSRWEDFRGYQDRVRRRFWKPEWFQKQVQFVRRYRQDKGLEGDICMLQNRKEQSRLDDWKEFQFYEYRTADAYMRDMKRAEADYKASEIRLQAAIDANLPAEEIEVKRMFGVGHDEARRGTAEADLKRQAVLLKWIDEQLPIIASECRQLGPRSETRGDHQSSSTSTHLGKRKRSMKETTDLAISRRKLARSCRGRENNQHTPNSVASPVINANNQNSTLAALAQQHPQRGKKVAHSRREPTLPNVTATSFRPRRAIARKNCQSAEKGATASSASHAWKISGPSQKNPSPKQAKSSGARGRAKQTTVQAQSRRLQVRRGQAAAHDASRRSPRPVNSAGVSKSRAKDSKVRGEKNVRPPHTNAQGRDGQPTLRQEEHVRKIETDRGGKKVSPGSRKKSISIDESVRRSQRISRMPVIRYSK